MGTDIHLFVEKQNEDGTWSRAKPAPWKCPWCGGKKEGPRGGECYWCRGAGETREPYHERNYDLFGMLADVRNGTGFAGVDTGDGFHPTIAAERGLPSDLSPELNRGRDVIDDEDGDDTWLGDHSFSWCTLAEALAYDYSRETKHRGVVDSATYAAWREGERGEPPSYCGGISGSKIRIVSNAEMDDLIARGVAPTNPYDHLTTPDGVGYFTQVEWSSTYRDAAGKAWFDFLDACRSIGAPEKVRLVFGFDS